MSPVGLALKISMLKVLLEIVGWIYTNYLPFSQKDFIFAAITL